MHHHTIVHRNARKKTDSLDFSDISQVFLCLLDEALQKICKKLKFHGDFMRIEMEELDYFEKTAKRARLATIFSYLE